MNIFNLHELVAKAPPLALTSNNVTVGFKSREVFPFDTEFKDNEIFLFWSHPMRQGKAGGKGNKRNVEKKLKMKYGLKGKCLFN